MGAFDWLDEEKQLFFISAVPPLLFTAWIFLLLQRSPQPIIESIATFVPGMRPPKFKDGMACLRLEASADIIHNMNKLLKEHNDMVASNLHATGVDHRHFAEIGASITRFANRLSHPRGNGVLVGGGISDQLRRRVLSDSDSQQPSEDYEEEEIGSYDLQTIHEQLSLWSKSEAEAGISEREVWVNPKHLSRLFLLPTLFVSLYFMDAAIMSREASVDFPLSDCMGDSTCFYITQPYAIFRYPRYTKLECGSMTEKSVTSDGFFYRAPPNARFYKCYTWVFNMQNLIQAVGDVVALLAVCTVIILYFCVDVSSGDLRPNTTEGRQEPQSPVVERVLTMHAGTLRRLKLQRRWCWIKLLTFVVLGFASIALVPMLYGKKTSDFTAYLGLPGICFFAVILLKCRSELLTQRIAELQSELHGDSDESGSGGSSGSEEEVPPVASVSGRSLGAEQRNAQRNAQSSYAPVMQASGQRVLMQV